MSWRGAAPVDLHPRERHRPEVDLEDVVEKGSRPGLLPREDVHVLAHSDAGATRAGCAPPAALHRERHLLPGDRLALDPALEDLVEDLKCPARARRRRGLRVPVSAKAKAPLLPLSPLAACPRRLTCPPRRRSSTNFRRTLRRALPSPPGRDRTPPSPHPPTSSRPSPASLLLVFLNKPKVPSWKCWRLSPRLSEEGDFFLKERILCVRFSVRENNTVSSAGTCQHFIANFQSPSLLMMAFRISVVFEKGRP